MDSSIPLVSFVIPAYHRKEKLEKAVDSVLNQTCALIELILIDDGSQPSLQPYFEQLKQKDNRVRYFINEKNRGVSFSRNLGLSEAKGEYVCFVDSDDYLAKDRIEAQQKFFFDYDLMICDYLLENKYEDHPKVVSQNPKFRLLERIVDRSLHLATLTLIWRKEFLEKNNLSFDPNLRNSEDYLFVVAAILKNPKIHYLDQAKVTVVKSFRESLTGNYQSKSNTMNKLSSHSRVFLMTFGKIPISESVKLLKKIIGFGGYILGLSSV